MASRKLGDINALEGCLRGSYAFSVVTGYTCVEDSLLDNTRAFLGLDSGVVKPGKKMKFIQRWILDKILYKLDPGDYAHGFIPGKTIYTNAKAHINKDLVLGIDIKDFFPNIKFVAVYNVFKSAGYTTRVSRQLADLCTYHWKLPQGAPTSSMLANLVALNLDKKISQYCIRTNLEYSRYADDITISGSYNLAIHKEIVTIQPG